LATLGEGHCACLAVGARAKHGADAGIVRGDESVVALIEEQTRPAGAIDLQLAAVCRDADGRAEGRRVSAREAGDVVGRQWAVDDFGQLGV
jgi:hypothetical protein